MSQSSDIVREAALERKGQPTFSGVFEHMLDPKRRITIPSQWRDEIASPREVRAIFDSEHGCLAVYGEMYLQGKILRMEEQEKLSEHSNPVVHNFLVTLGEQSERLQWDTQGRIRICDRLLEAARLTDQVILVGATRFFQVWNPDLHTESRKAMAPLHEVLRQVKF